MSPPCTGPASPTRALRNERPLALTGARLPHRTNPESAGRESADCRNRQRKQACAPRALGHPLLVQLDSLIGVGGQFRTDREATAGGGGRTGRSRRRSPERASTTSTRDWSCTGPTAASSTGSGRSSSRRRRRSPTPGGSSVTSCRRLAARRSVPVGRGYRPMIRSSCRSRTPAGTSAIAVSRNLVSSGEEARAMRAAAREPSTRRRARGARTRS
jgi:hypothetical protein